MELSQVDSQPLGSQPLGSSSLFQSVLELINDGVYIVDPSRRIMYWNQASERITGFTRERVMGQFCAANILMHVNGAGELLCLGQCPLAHTLQDGQMREASVYLHHADGHRVSVTVLVIPLAGGADGQITGAIEIFSENVSLAAALGKIDDLQRAIALDDLTGISTRRVIRSHMDRAYREWQDSQQPFGLLMIDVDHFKQINDTYGHAVGDRVLKMVANSLSHGLRAYDFIGRWGGEEFVALVSSVGPAELREVAERLRMLVERSFLILNDTGAAASRSPENNVRVTASIGGTIAQAGDTLENVLERADQKMYESKHAGRNRVTV